MGGRGESGEEVKEVLGREGKGRISREEGRVGAARLGC